MSIVQKFKMIEIQGKKIISDIQYAEVKTNRTRNHLFDVRIFKKMGRIQLCMEAEEFLTDDSQN